jgi:hypothetical protein
MAGVLGDYTGSYAYDASNETIIFSAAPDAKFDLVFEATNTSAYWVLFLALAGDFKQFCSPCRFHVLLPLFTTLNTLRLCFPAGFLLYHYRQGTISQLQRWPLFALTFSYGGLVIRGSA